MNSAAYPLPQLTKLAHYGFATLFENPLTTQRSLHTTVALTTGDVFATFDALKILSSPTKYTVQVNEDIHVTLLPEFLQYVNHSCNPNIFFDTERMELRCLRSIDAGDEFTFFYPSTEWSMAEPFKCFCGLNNCLREIQGASFLSQDAVAANEFTAFIRFKLSGTRLQKV